MEQNNQIKTIFSKNLPSLNIKSQLNLNIDSNTHINQVLDIQACLIDSQIEVFTNKATIKGLIGIKVMYVDTDNMFNTISDSINFTETLTDEIINNDSLISINNIHFLTDFDNDDKNLRISIEGIIECFCTSNNILNTLNSSSKDLICKKNIVSATSCVQQINKTTNFDFDFKLDTKINKMLSYDSKVIIEDNSCCDGYILVKGQILNNIIYEVEQNETNIIKIYSNSTPFKCEIEATSCDNECVADLSAYINLNTTQITPDITDNETKFNFEYYIVFNGYVYKTINIDVVEDVYSLDNFVEPETSIYKTCQKQPYIKVSENVDTEITLSDELNIDEILGMINTNSNVIQHSIKENAIIIEGVVNGNLLYLDENRCVKQLPTQLPYSISIKQESIDNLCGLHLSVVPTNCKCKIKRGNILMVDYELFVTGNAYTKKEISLIDNIKFGKPLNYGDISFQIYIAKPNENIWELCKRLHISQEKLVEYNNEIPTTYSGGEKIVVYR